MSEFTELWRDVSRLCDSKTLEKKDRNTVQQMAGTATSPVCQDFQSPKHKGSSRYLGLIINGDSPGDVEPSQDIFWDSTSPTQANTRLGLKNSRTVEISEIVNRIAPKDVKPRGATSPLLQWIGDSATQECTPEVRKPRLRKRQSKVEDLMKLARQFDERMQQNSELAGQLDTVNNVSEHVNHTETKVTEKLNLSNVKVPECLSSSDQVEKELQGLFDCPTQSGSFSQGSLTSTSPLEPKDQPATSTLAEHKKSDPKSAGEKGSSSYSANNCDFDDDWEDDDLLNDCFVLAMIHNPDEHDTNPKTTFQSDIKTDITRFTPMCNPAVSTNVAKQASKPSCSILQELCPKPKTTNRRTFKLEPNPHLQSKVSDDITKSSFTGIQQKPQTFEKKSAISKTGFSAQPDKTTNKHSTLNSVKDIADSLWDDGDDDELLYQVCDSVERIANSETQEQSFRSCQEKKDIAVDRQQKTIEPLPVDMAWSTNNSASVTKRSSYTFVRSNSLPGTSCKTMNYQGRNIPMKGAGNKSNMSQSFPGSHMNLDTLTQCRESSGTFQTGNANSSMMPQTVTARASLSSKPHHASFKRNVSDSAVTSSKVFVTSQMAGKCSAAEIERKKQEALARRRLRMQNNPKP
ncbi:uncharacterized protein etaa1b [Pholidichthys leucotaenia]